MFHSLQQRSLCFWLCSILLLLLSSGCLEAIPTPIDGEDQAVSADLADASLDDGIVAAQSETVTPAFDIVHAQVRREGAFLLFEQVVVGEAGAIVPTATGELAGAAVESYVWPTSLDTAAVDFAPEQGILALAVTAHPDFDDTPLVDEDGDGDKANDGRLWHSHWVVLVEDAECGAGLKVRDIPEGETPVVPATWPELPLLIDSPNYELELTGSQLTVRVAHQPFAEGKLFNYDGVAAGLQVNADLHAPLLCVTSVHDIASGDLSLPGVVE